MALWKDLQGRVHDDMDGTAVHLLPAGCTPVSQEEADTLRAPPPPTTEQLNALVQGQIDELEATSHMNRFVREAMIMLSVQQATALGVTEPQLYAANIGYHKIKDLDDQIAILRSKFV